MKLKPFGFLSVLLNRAAGIGRVPIRWLVLLLTAVVGANLYDPSEVSSAVYYVSCSVTAVAIVFALWVRRKPASLNKSRQPG